MKHEVNEQINIHKNKLGCVMGLGPSLAKYSDELVKLSKTQKDKMVFVSCNYHDEMFDLDTDYWVVCNPEMTVGKFSERFNAKSKCTLVFADNIDLTPHIEIEQKLKVNCIPFDQRHFNNQPCSECERYGCGKKMVKNRKTIQEVVQKVTNYNEMYGAGDTVALHMLALAIIFGCNPIYLFGIDLDYTGKNHYFKSGFEANAECQFLPTYVDRIVKDFGVLYKSAQKNNIDIYSTMPNSPVNNHIPFKEFII